MKKSFAEWDGQTFDLALEEITIGLERGQREKLLAQIHASDLEHLERTAAVFNWRIWVDSSGRPRRSRSSSSPTRWPMSRARNQSSRQKFAQSKMSLRKIRGGRSPAGSRRRCS